MANFEYWPTVPDSMTLLSFLSVLSLLAVASGCNCHSSADQKTSTESSMTPLQQAVDDQWSLLSDELEFESADEFGPLTYQLEEQCPLLYDFMIHWPLRSQFATETRGRFEMRPSPRDATAVEIRNRAVGSYPLYNDIRHPGQEWWYEEIDTVDGHLHDDGFDAETPWSAVWVAPRSPLSISAFFSALPATDEDATSWTLVADSEHQSGDDSLALDVTTENWLRIQGDRAAVLVARSQEDNPPFYGRYLISERGRLLAAAWSAPASEDEYIAAASIRLTAACDGAIAPPLPQERETSDKVVETWSRFTDALRGGDHERILSYLAPSLREHYGDETLVAIFDQLLETPGPDAFGSVVPHSLTEHDHGLIEFDAAGRMTHEPARAVLTEVTARTTDTGVHFVEFSSSSHYRSDSSRLFELRVED